MADCPRILAVLAATLLAAAGVCRGQANFEPRRTIEEQIVAPSPQVAEMMRYEADYQGNISGVVNTATKELEQYQDYYPYGKPHDTAVDDSDNRRKFGGKELITDKGYDAYDFEARPLTLTIPRFTQPDSKAEIYYPTSIYAYCGGDPINLIDPTGMWSLWKSMCDNSKRI